MKREREGERGRGRARLSGCAEPFQVESQACPDLGHYMRGLKSPLTCGGPAAPGWDSCLHPWSTFLRHLIVKDRGTAVGARCTVKQTMTGNSETKIVMDVGDNKDNAYKLPHLPSLRHLTPRNSFLIWAGLWILCLANQEIYWLIHHLCCSRNPAEIEE